MECPVWGLLQSSPRDGRLAVEVTKRRLQEVVPAGFMRGWAPHLSPSHGTAGGNRENDIPPAAYDGYNLSGSPPTFADSGTRIDVEMPPAWHPAWTGELYHPSSPTSVQPKAKTLANWLSLEGGMDEVMLRKGRRAFPQAFIPLKYAQFNKHVQAGTRLGDWRIRTRPTVTPKLELRGSSPPSACRVPRAGGAEIWEGPARPCRSSRIRHGPPRVGESSRSPRTQSKRS